LRGSGPPRCSGHQAKRSVFRRDTSATPRSGISVSAPAGWSCRIWRVSTRRIADGALDSNPALGAAFAAGARPGAALHLFGLVSDGGVHSHLDHALALVDLARRRGVTRLHLHAFLDGRDTPPRSARPLVERLERHLAGAGFPPIASVIGRYWAMDRDNRWERTERAWRCLTRREGDAFPTADAAIAAAYAAGTGDEFVAPAVIAPPPPPGPAGREGAARDASVKDGDAVIFFNFRADRARQITRAFTEAGFDRFRRSAPPVLAQYVCFTTYDRSWSLPVAFPPQTLRGTFGEVVSGRGWPQLRIAETEKYAHVTYFFNGGVETPFPGESRCLVPSPPVATYDLQPEMSARAVTRELLARLQATPRQAVVLNYANADMVGHTGLIEPTRLACRVVDESVAAVVGETLRLGGVAVVTRRPRQCRNDDRPAHRRPADRAHHEPGAGACRRKGLEGRRLRDGGLLADVAPTMLEIMGVELPREMEGRSLLTG